jgi:putative zinc finger protein
MNPIRTCKEVHRLVAESMDRKMGFFERLTLRLHLTLCDNCTRFKQHMLVLRAALSRSPGDGD